MTKDIWTEIQPFKIPNTPYTMIGHSCAARQTTFYIPELRLMLDCAVPNTFTAENIFCTHGHCDHMGHLPLNIIDTSSVKTNIYVPHEILANTKNFIHAFYVLSTNNPTPKIHKKYTLFGVNSQSEPQINIKIKNMNWKVDIIKCHHTVPCVGYGFIDVRKKMKPEYLNTQKEDIISLKKSGIEITEQKDYPLFCYIGDTYHTILTNPILEKYPTIIIECTFLYAEHLEFSKENKHIHWTNLEPYIKTHPNIIFVLCHFSFRYEIDEIHNFFEPICEIYKNIVIWIKDKEKEKDIDKKNLDINVIKIE
jgi:ribonuclease Z